MGSPDKGDKRRVYNRLFRRYEFVECNDEKEGIDILSTTAWVAGTLAVISFVVAPVMESQGMDSREIALTLASLQFLSAIISVAGVTWWINN